MAVIAVVFALGLGAALAQPAPTAPAKADAEPEGVLRCGWFEHPAKGQAWLTDRDGRWLVAVPGGHQAQGRWPRFTPERWVRTQGNYGYGCACLRMVANGAAKTVDRIIRAGSRVLETCQRAKGLRHPESP